MRVLVAIKRVPAPGAKIVLAEDGQRLDTRHLGFTVSPHEECAIEAAVQLIEEHGGSSTVVSLGPPVAEEQLRMAVSMGIDRAVLVETDDEELDAQGTARALTDAIRALETEDAPFDLLLFGNESADAGNHQVGIRVAHALGRPVAGGIKAMEPVADRLRLQRAAANAFEILELPLPCVVAVKEGINLPRYPAMRGRLAAKKAEIRRLPAPPHSSDVTRLGLRHPEQQESETTLLGSGAGAAPAVVALFEEVGLL